MLMRLLSLRSRSPLLGTTQACLASVLAAFAGSLLPSTGAIAQGMLPGCQLIDGSLQCVPGLRADPEQQIRILRQEITADQAQETVVGQEQKAVSQILLAGPAVVGAVLTASVAAAQPQAANAPVLGYHWYRLAPGQQSWQLIPEAQGSSYRLTPGDADQQVMVVSVSGIGSSILRVSSTPVGPVTPLAP